MNTNGRSYSRVFYSCLLVVLGACTTPIKNYTPDYLLPGDYANILKTNPKVGLSTDNFCTGFQRDWDSILIVKPYTRASSIQSLKIENYSAVEPFVKAQSLSDGTCTLLFVKDNRYIGHSLFPRTIDLSTIGGSNSTRTIWITASDCKKIFIKKADNNASSYLFFSILQP